MGVLESRKGGTDAGRFECCSGFIWEANREGRRRCFLCCCCDAGNPSSSIGISRGSYTYAVSIYQPTPMFAIQQSARQFQRRHERFRKLGTTWHTNSTLKAGRQRGANAPARSAPDARTPFFLLLSGEERTPAANEHAIEMRPVQGCATAAAAQPQQMGVDLARSTAVRRSAAHAPMSL